MIEPILAVSDEAFSASGDRLYNEWLSLGKDMG